MECVRIQSANYVQDYRIWLRFNTGEEGEVDLAELIQTIPAAKPLKDTATFAQFHLDEWPTLSWDCGFDVAPEYLYELSIGAKKQQSL
jgi:hypothetical protein